jgi:hypothetical protein
LMGWDVEAEEHPSNNYSDIIVSLETKAAEQRAEAQRLNAVTEQKASDPDAQEAT